MDNLYQTAMQFAVDVGYEKIVIFFIILTFALLEMRGTGFFRKKGTSADDHWADGVAFVWSGLLMIPLLFGAVFAFMDAYFPEAKNSLAHWPFVAQFAMFLIFDDMLQYWWHRACHTFPLMYGYHRAHHEASYMSVRMTYRNNLFYNTLIPGWYFSALLIYVGFGWTYAVYLIIKQLVQQGAHSDVKWDQFLYKNKKLAPLAWVVERTISTPSTHFMHHGKHLSDGISHYKGNYSNLLFLWDIIFGTAKITRKYPPEFGTEGLKPVSWVDQILSPFGAYPVVDEAEAQSLVKD